MATIQIKRGLQENVQALVLKEGELAVALDTGSVYVGTKAGAHHVNPKADIVNSARKLETARKFSVSGDGTANAISFDGSQDVALALTLASQSGLSAGTYTKLTVNGKGLVTAAENITVSDVSGLGTAATKNTGTASGNVVVVGSDGKIDESVIPSIAITDLFEADSQAAMLAVSGANKGDICVRSDEGKSYILKKLPASNLDNWVWLKTPDCKVVSVAGKTGAVTLTKADVGLDKVANTADADKEVKAAAQLKTARTIALSGGVTGTATSFDGSKNITIPVTSVSGSAITGDIDGGTF